MSTMGSYTKKKLSLNTVSVNLGCSCSRPKLSLLFHPKPKLKTTKKPHKRQHQHHHYSSSSSWTNDDDEASTTTTTTNTAYTTTTTTSSSSSTTPLSPNDNYSSKTTTTKKGKNYKNKNKGKEEAAGRGFGRVGGEGVAVEKDSDDPYLDFRHSMLQMILENEIYSKDDLRELLNCFLQLNSPTNHGIIVRAFTEIWDGVFSVRSSLQHSNVQANSCYYYGNNNSYNYNDQNVSRDNCYYYY